MSPDPSAMPAGTDVAAEDWDVMFNAIKLRLLETIDALPELRDEDELRSAQASMLECMQALEQLHLAALDELERRQAALDETMQNLAPDGKSSGTRTGRPPDLNQGG